MLTGVRNEDTVYDGKSSLYIRLRLDATQPAGDKLTLRLSDTGRTPDSLDPYILDSVVV